MIKVSNISKSFDNIKAVDNISCEIKNSSIFGLIGSNGAGKSTFLRILAGIIKPDSGDVSIDGKSVYENVSAKRSFFYISDEQFFIPNSTPKSMMEFYERIYPNFDSKRFFKLLSNFELDPKRKIKTFSKGMKKQVSIILGLSAKTDYVFCDETFDGLDPVARQAIKSIFAADIADRCSTFIIASHNLRELEDICDHVGLLHKGGILFSRDLEQMKLDIHKIQCIFDRDISPNEFDGIDVICRDKRGSLITITARGNIEEITEKIHRLNPVFLEALPLSLEEIFISETEVMGYDIKKLIM